MFSELTKKRMETCEKIYQEIVSLFDNAPLRSVPIEGDLFNEIITHFNPALSPYASRNLSDTYLAAYHVSTKSLIISNQGATLFCLSPKSDKPFLARHIGMSIMVPGHGQEFVNVGIIGDIYTKPFVLRAESACTPSFLFGSQRCNCAHQWDMTQELAADFNPIQIPTLTDGNAFEDWVKGQLKLHRPTRQHTFLQKGRMGFLLMHLDTQNGMGSGYTPNEFVLDLYGRASLRHRGEYTSEQIFNETMAGGFRAIGLEPDPRSHDEKVGYQIIPIVLDFLKAYRKVIFLSNNPFKIDVLNNFGYTVDRIKLIGAVNLAGAKEARERGLEFGHLDINEQELVFDLEQARLKQDISARIEPEHEVQL